MFCALMKSNIMSPLLWFLRLLLGNQTGICKMNTYTYTCWLRGFESSSNSDKRLFDRLFFCLCEKWFLLKNSTAATPLAGWSITVVNQTSRSIGISWSSPTSLINGGIRFYVVLAGKINSSSESFGEILAGNVTASEITELDEYTEYKVTVVAVDGYGMPYKSAEVLVMTDEGGEFSTINYDVQMQSSEEQIFPRAFFFSS